MENQPLVSVIMNCYNGEKYLAEAIESVLNQTYKNFEIIFWDNVSTDKSKSIVESYKDDRIKYFLADKHTPLGEARNCALEKIKGRFLCILDTDDIFMPNKLETQVNYMLKNPDVILGYSNCKYIILDKGKEQIIENEKEGFTGSLFKELFTKTNFIYLSTIIINVKLAGKELYFKSEYQITEEYELFLRLSLIGRFVYSKGVLGMYRIHPNSFMRKPENNIVYFNERLRILDQFEDEIKNKKIKIKKIKDELYYNYTLRLIRDGKISMAKKNIPKLKKSKSLKNILIYFILIFNLGIMYKNYYRLKYYNRN